LVPRALACKGDASVKRSAAPVFRQIQYEETGELEDFISQPQLGGKIYNLRDEFECITVDTPIDNDTTPVADKNRPTTSCNGFTHVAAEGFFYILVEKRGFRLVFWYYLIEHCRPFLDTEPFCIVTDLHYALLTNTKKVRNYYSQIRKGPL